MNDEAKPAPKTRDEPDLPKYELRCINAKCKRYRKGTASPPTGTPVLCTCGGPLILFAAKKKMAA